MNVVFLFEEVRYEAKDKEGSFRRYYINVTLDRHFKLSPIASRVVVVWNFSFLRIDF